MDNTIQEVSIQNLQHRQKGPYHPTTATSLKRSLKNRLPIPFFETISWLSQVAQLLKRREFMLEMKKGACARDQAEMVGFIALRFPSSKKPAGLKCRSQVTGQVTGHRSQVTGHRSQVKGQVTGHRSHKKTIGHWTKLFWTDVLLYKNKISQGTLMIFLSFKQY